MPFDSREIDPCSADLVFTVLNSCRCAGAKRDAKTQRTQ
jgi:hypothetical protein